MQNRYKLFLISTLSILLSSSFVSAQTSATPAPPNQAAPPAEETSLEEELNQAQTTQTPPAPAPTSELTIQPTEPVTPTTNEVVMDAPDDSSPNLDDEAYAMNGLSFGLTGFVHNYNVDATMFVDDGTADGKKVDLSSKSADFQSVGVVVRYAILPLNRVGTDFVFTVGNTINHSSVNFGSITTARAELNLAYTIDFGKTNALYFFAGGGYEVIHGQDINRLVVPGGGLFQGGAGITFNKKFSLEGLYSYASHRVNQRYLNEAANAAQLQTDFTRSANTVTSNVIQGRLTYAF
ncbi:hypothetical protein K2P97_02460 [bacterium]|nr:hypothetical protein [bacterium]